MINKLTPSVSRSATRHKGLIVGAATAAVTMALTLTGCGAGPKEDINGAAGAAGAAAAGSTAAAPTMNSDLNVWNTTPTITLAGTGQSGSSTAHPSYNCGDYNKIHTSTGVMSAFPYGNATTSLGYGWNYSSDNKTWVTATSLGVENELGDIQFSFVNASVTGSHTVSASFRCSGQGADGADLVSLDVSAPTDVTGTSATVHATMNEFSDWKTNPKEIYGGSYFVEYGSVDGFYTQTSPVYQLGKDVTNPSVTAQLTGLDPSTNYHYRFVINPLTQSDTPKGMTGDTLYGNPHNTFTTAPAERMTIAVPGSDSAQLLEVNDGSTADGATVDTWARTTSGDGTADNEAWHLSTVGAGTSGNLVNIASKKCLQVNGSTGAVDQWTCAAGAGNQVWTKSVDSSGDTRLQVTLTNVPNWADGDYYLATTSKGSDVANGQALTLQPVASADARSIWNIKADTN